MILLIFKDLIELEIIRSYPKATPCFISNMKTAKPERMDEISKKIREYLAQKLSDKDWNDQIFVIKYFEDFKWSDFLDDPEVNRLIQFVKGSTGCFNGKKLLSILDEIIQSTPYVERAAEKLNKFHDIVEEQKKTITNTLGQLKWENTLYTILNSKFPYSPSNKTLELRKKIEQNTLNLEIAKFGCLTKMLEQTSSISSEPLRFSTIFQSFFDELIENTIEQ